MALYEIPDSVATQIDEQFKDETGLKLGTILQAVLVAVNTNQNATSILGAGLTDYADDAAAATGGVAVGGLYRTSSAVKVRVA